MYSPSKSKSKNYQKHSRKYSNGETIIMNSDYKKQQIELLTDMLKKKDLPDDKREYWEKKLKDVKMAPTQPPDGWIYFF